jgi:regulator of sirC expression with transglutaminase-like and TPR domain
LAHAADYLRDHPSNWSLRFVVASIHEALGDVASARLELERVVETEPEMPLPHYRLAMLYRNREADRGRARVHLEAYLRLTPKGPHAAEVRSALSEVTDVSTGPQFVAHPGTIERRVENVP